ncbi:MAG: metal-dependent transcriptional regulator [bacterium]|nr:metal-dependent transcriptional regulator [bacterium]MBK8127685.1 metal-dependent transcriptional regulator [bacterium]
MHNNGLGNGKSFQNGNGAGHTYGKFSKNNIEGLTATRENYLRTLFQLSRGTDGVRLTDLARTEGVRLPTARHAVNCLRELGLATQENYGKIQLTATGEEIGRQICDRFDLTRKFLIEVLGVRAEAAEREASVMEHHLEEDTLERLAAFVKHVTNCPGGQYASPDCLVNLRATMDEAIKISA